MNRFLLAAALLCTPIMASGQVVSVQTGPLSFLYSQVPQWNGQSFTATAGDILGAGAYLISPNAMATGTLTMHLYDARPDLGGTLLASGTQAFTLAGSSSGWVDVFWAGVNATIGGTYWLSTQSVLDQPEQVYTWGSLNAYAGGISTVTYTPSGPDASPDLVWDGYDHAMRVWSTGQSPVDPPPSEEPVTVPEPSTLALLLTSIAGVAMRWRPRRA